MAGNGSLLEFFTKEIFDIPYRANNGVVLISVQGFLVPLHSNLNQKMTVVIKNLAQKVDFLTKFRSNQDCRSICAGTVILEIQKFNTSGTENYNNFCIKSFALCNNKTICWVINLLGTILCVTICIIEKHNSFISFVHFLGQSESSQPEKKSTTITVDTKNQEKSVKGPLDNLELLVELFPNVEKTSLIDSLLSSHGM